MTVSVHTKKALPGDLGGAFGFVKINSPLVLNLKNEVRLQYIIYRKCLDYQTPHELFLKFAHGALAILFTEPTLYDILSRYVKPRLKTPFKYSAVREEQPPSPPLQQTGRFPL